VRRSAGLLTLLLLCACDEEVVSLRVWFAGWSPAFHSVDLYADGAWVARLNKTPLCPNRTDAWCADGVKARLVDGRTYRFTVVGTDRYGKRLPSQEIIHTYKVAR